MKEKRPDNFIDSIESMGLQRNSFMLFQIYATCESSLVEYCKALESALQNNISDEELGDYLVFQASKKNIIIIFAHIFLEALIYDFCAINFSDSYTRNYIDKLNFLSKWVVIPRLVTGEDFSTDSQAFQLLTKVNTYRNQLVHLKTKKINNEKLEKECQNINLDLCVSECFECMGEALLELKKIGEDKSEMFKMGMIKKIINRDYRSIWDRHIKNVRKIMGINIDE
ncbi:hypothetical protein JW887_06190 [Candidatus Dojkabacteria bacterium]|nr:hypothetical protein [Candidatus Dojkabacteria bacterium]